MIKVYRKYLTSTRHLIVCRALAIFSLAICSSLSQAQDKWVGSWASAQQGVNVTFGGVAPVFNDQTLRQVVRISLGGSTLRVRLSNVMGTTPLTVDAASMAKRTSGAAIDDDTLRPLTFSGSESVTIPDGAFVLSDPVSLSVNAFDDLSISLYLANETTVLTQHSAALQTNYVSTAGDQTSATELSVESMNESWYLLSGIDVIAPSDTNVIAMLGDSITDGTESTADTNSRYPDFLARRLAATGESVAVLNLGIAGNRVLHGAIGPNALSRFDRDVVARPGVTHVVFLEGINDIGLAGLLGIPEQEVTAEQIIDGYRQLILRAHTAGIKIIGATLTPFKSFLYFTDEGEEKRIAVNEWIRNESKFDGYIDFDMAVRDPENPSQFLPVYDSGDNLHPSDEGYRAMADAIDLSLIGVKDEQVEFVLTASRYDARQGEIFWEAGSYDRFNVYRNDILQSLTPIGGNSFYQNSLDGGQSYLYEITVVDVAGNESGVLASVTMPSDTFLVPDSLVDGQRYDDTQGEIFWDKQGFSQFLIYRDDILVTPEGNTGSSFYQNNLNAGQAYIFEVFGVDSVANETTIGKINMPGMAGQAVPIF